MHAGRIVKWAAGIVATGLGIFGLAKAYGGAKPQEYSDKWFDTVSDEVLDAEREVVRQKYCAVGGDFSLGVALQNLLRRFDSEMNKRACGGEKSHAPSVHREHGWYLPNDD